jgi:hypothetical protein
MYTIEEFEEWAKDSWNILLDIRISESNLKRLNYKVFENEEEIKEMRFFDHYRHQQAFLVIIQLCKLLTDSKNQKGNLHKIISKLKNDLSPDLERLITSNAEVEDPEIGTFLKILGDIKNELILKKPLIQKLTDLRNKQYAHKDNVSIPQISFEELQELIDFADSIFKALTLRVEGKTWHSEYTEPWDIDQIFSYLSKGFENS